MNEEGCIIINMNNVDVDTNENTWWIWITFCEALSF